MRNKYPYSFILGILTAISWQFVFANGSHAVPMYATKAYKIEQKIPLSDFSLHIQTTYQSLCSDLTDTKAVPVFEKYALEENRMLLFLQCTHGAYNVATLAIVGKNGSFDHWDILGSINIYRNGAVGAGHYFYNPGFNAETQTLSTFNKGRGMADCGTMQEYKLENNIAQLQRYWRDDECEGKEIMQPTDEYLLFDSKSK